MISHSSINFEEEIKNIVCTFSNNIFKATFWVIVAQSIPHINKIMLLLNYIYYPFTFKTKDTVSENKTQYCSLMLSFAELNFILICLCFFF